MGRGSRATAAFVASAATSVIGGSPTTGTTAGIQAGRTFDPNAYFVDPLFRSDHPSPDRNDASVRGEAGLILAYAIRQGDISAADKNYLTELVAATTGLSQPDAKKRVSEVFDEARQAADTARKAVAHSLYWLFLALLIGAFCASYAATIGGKQRDHLIVV